MRPIGTDGPYCPWCSRELGTTDRDDSVLPCGATLRNGQYIIGKVLGRGGFGVTYLGMNRQLELKVAIKEYYPRNEAARDENSPTLTWSCSERQKEAGCESFVREAKKMAHMATISNVVMVHDIIEQENNTAYIVMGYVEGETLRQRVRTAGTALSPKDCFLLLSPIFHALSEIHSQGLIHRDVSPDNLMVDTHEKIWLLDLGAAREAGYVPEEKNGGPLFVKHGYSPPEQYRRERRIGPWSDVYALCATVYYCLTGVDPPDARKRETGAKLLFPADLPPDVTSVLSKGMDMDPSNRIQTVAELEDALRAAISSSESRPIYATELLGEASRRENDASSTEILADSTGPAESGANRSTVQADSKAPISTAHKNRLFVLLPLVMLFAAAAGAVLWFFGRGTAHTRPELAVPIADDGGVETPTDSTPGVRSGRYDFILSDCSWTEAFERARRSGGHLARIQTGADLQRITAEAERLELTDVEFRIGGRRDPDEEAYYWVDDDGSLYGEPLNSSNHWINALWLEGEPTLSWNGNVESCLELYFDSPTGKWVLNDVADQTNDGSYIGRYGYIIEYAPADNGASARRFSYIFDSCSWTEAFEKAKQAGGKLACLDTEEVFLAVKADLAALNIRNARFCVGGSRDNGTMDYYWRDADGNPYGSSLNHSSDWTAQAWRPDEPSFQWGEYQEQYIALSYSADANDWFWNDIMNVWDDYTADKFGYIIEYSI